MEVDNDEVTYIPSDEGNEEYWRIIRNRDDELIVKSVIRITVTFNSEQVEAISDEILTDDDTDKTIDVIQNNVDPEDNPLTVTEIIQPQIG